MKEHYAMWLRVQKAIESSLQELFEDVFSMVRGVIWNFGHYGYPGQPLVAYASFYKLRNMVVAADDESVDVTGGIVASRLRLL